MQTISDLNSRWWYRLVKVVYAIVLIIILTILINEDIVNDPLFSPHVGEAESYITCIGDNTKHFLTKNNLKLSYYDGLLTTESDRKAHDLCITASQTVTHEETSTISTADTKKSYTYEQLIALGAKPVGSGDYTLAGIPTDRDWLRTVGYSLLYIVLALFITEVIRRIFYYIILGRIKPEK